MLLHGRPAPGSTYTTCQLAVNSTNCQVDKDAENLSAKVLCLTQQSESNCTDRRDHTSEGEQSSSSQPQDAIIGGEDILENENFATSSDLPCFDENGENIIRNFNDLKEDGDLIEMLAGYLVYRVGKNFPEKAHLYGSFSKDVNKPLRTSWLQKLSRGWLTVPNDDFINVVKKMEKEFDGFHANVVNKSKNVFQALKERISCK